jgi:hypothetical protein
MRFFLVFYKNRITGAKEPKISTQEFPETYNLTKQVK